MVSDQEGISSMPPCPSPVIFQFWKPKCRESEQLFQVAKGDNGTHQSGKNPGFSPYLVAFLLRLHESLMSHLSRAWSYAAALLTCLERSVWILSTPARWRPSAEPSLGLSQSSAPTGTKGQIEAPFREVK